MYLDICDSIENTVHIHVYYYELTSLMYFGSGDTWSIPLFLPGITNK